jgi:DNA polymerase-3 subunit epsilon
MNLFFDTETSGLPNWRAPSDHPSQPHLLQLAFIHADYDGGEAASWQSIVRPYAGCVIAPEALAAHGISLERAMDEGIDAKVAIEAMMDLAGKSSQLVGRNISFDIRILRITITRSHGFKWEPRIPAFCTMQAATPIVNLPPTPRMVAAGFTKPKSASLTECVRHFFDEELEGAHDALVDVRACKRVYHALCREKAQ